MQYISLLNNVASGASGGQSEGEDAVDLGKFLGAYFNPQPLFTRARSIQSLTLDPKRYEAHRIIYTAP
jgi:hypothetical protein